MKVLIYTDNHFCEKYSLISGYGSKYSIRIENQLKSINWVENLASEKDCQYIICAGDFFDQATLTDQELTALRDIHWRQASEHYFLVGNHESEENDLHFNSTKALEGKNRFIISEPKLFKEPGFELAFLPYITESDRKPLSEYFPELTDTPRILISHNDLFGIQMGPVVSRAGFDPKELEKYCSICINGHLHNGQQINKKVLNLGNLTGKDFGEDALRYQHKVIIIDTNTMTTEFIENPYAFNFYKLEILDKKDIQKLTNLKQNAVVSLKCLDTLAPEVKEIIKSSKNILESRVITIKATIGDGETTYDISDLTMDHLARFYEICKEKIENTEVLEQELAEILK